MKKIILIIIMTLFLCSCTSNNNESLEEYNSFDIDIKSLKVAVKVDGYSKFLDKLDGGKFYVIEKNKYDYPMLRGDYTDLKLKNNLDIQIYEYTDAKLLYDDLNSISDDGFGIAMIKKGKVVGDTDHGWGKQPHFYLFDNLSYHDLVLANIRWGRR